MNFELLPNEILLDLFEYFSINDLFQSFFHLNSRFNQLLCVQFRKLHLDLRLISKTNFHHICENYVPLIIHQIISLHLSNDDDTPQQMELFLSQHYQLRQFIRLQSLSLSHLRSQQILDQIMNECSYLPCLTNLTFTNGYIQMSQSDAGRFFNQIWSLKQLTHCYIKIQDIYQNDFPNRMIVSTSLKYLIIENISCSLFTLSHLCQHTPNLAYLSNTFMDHSNQLEFSLPTLSITRLKIRFCSSIDILKHLLQSMPDLHHLTFEADDIDINGYQWEKMIRKYLPKLKTFQLKMSSAILNDNDKDTETQLNEVVDAYRTKFWIDEHQWFVRCHLWIFNDDEEFHNIELFTLPCTFDTPPLSGSAHILEKSTSPYDDGLFTCNRVVDLYYNSSILRIPPMSRFRFNYLKHLMLLFPLDDQFFSVFCGLDQLTSLYISVGRDENPDTIQSQLQILLDRTPHLRVLNFGTRLLSNFEVAPMVMTSVSVRRLSLWGFMDDNRWHYFDDKQWCYFDDEQCVQLSRSPLGIQCKTLSIRVKNRRNIVDLVNNMPNLQALLVRSEDDIWANENNQDPIPSIQGELVYWLRDCLPSSCMITRDIRDIYSIRLWIR